MVPTLSLAGTRSLLVFGGNVTAARLLWFYYSQVDMLVAGKMLGKEAVGAYSVAMHLASLPVQKISGIINQVAYPAFAQIQSNPDLVATHFLRAVRLLCFFAFPVLWGISSVAPEIVKLLLGDKWSQAIFPLLVLPAIMPLRMISNFLPSALDAVGRPDISVRNLIVASVVMPLAFVIGSQWEVEGLCAAWVLAFPVVFMSNLNRSLPAINVRLSDVGRAMLRPAICSAFMYGSILVTGKVLFRDASDGVRLALMIAVGATAYPLFAFALNRDGCKDVLDAFRRK